MKKSPVPEIRMTEAALKRQAKIKQVGQSKLKLKFLTFNILGQRKTDKINRACDTRRIFIFDAKLRFALFASLRSAIFREIEIGN